MSEFHARVVGCELPVHSSLRFIALMIPGPHFFIEILQIIYPAFVKALVRKGRELYLSDVQPATVLRSVMYLELLHDPKGFFRRERLIQRSDVVSIQIVHDKNYPLRIRIVLIDQFLHLIGPIYLAPLRQGLGPAPAGQRFCASRPTVL